MRVGDAEVWLVGGQRPGKGEIVCTFGRDVFRSDVFRSDVTGLVEVKVRQMLFRS